MRVLFLASLLVLSACVPGGIADSVYSASDLFRALGAQGYTAADQGGTFGTDYLAWAHSRVQSERGPDPILAVYEFPTEEQRARAEAEVQAVMPWAATYVHGPLVVAYDGSDEGLHRTLAGLLWDDTAVRERRLPIRTQLVGDVMHTVSRPPVGPSTAVTFWAVSRTP